MAPHCLPPGIHALLPQAGSVCVTNSTCGGRGHSWVTLGPGLRHVSTHCREAGAPPRTQPGPRPHGLLRGPGAEPLHWSPLLKNSVCSCCCGAARQERRQLRAVPGTSGPALAQGPGCPWARHAGPSSRGEPSGRRLLHTQPATARGGGRAQAGSPEKFQGDRAPGLCLHALPPELELRVDGAVEQEVLTEAFRVKSTNGGVVADLLRYEPEAQVFPRQGSKREREGSPLVTAKPKKAGSVPVGSKAWWP